jgi:hypothetical protein
MYFAITSSVTLPELQQKYPRAHRCRPQNCFFKCGYSASRWCAVFPFSHLQQAADRHLRWDRYEQMYVVLGHMPFHDLHLVLPAYIPDQISHPLGHISSQGRPSIFRYPHQMQMDLENRMRAVSVIRHPPSLVPGARAEAVA